MNAKPIAPVPFIQLQPRATLVAQHPWLAQRARPVRRPRPVPVESDTLFERMTMGDGVAMEELRERFGDSMEKAAMAILFDREEAERIVALVFEDASAGWPPERGHVERWLLRLVRRAARARRSALEGHGD
jgi:hypothetical protein